MCEWCEFMGHSQSGMVRGEYQCFCSCHTKRYQQVSMWETEQNGKHDRSDDEHHL